MSTILITGGTGLIGKALCKLLLEKGYDVIILTRNKPSTKKNENADDRVSTATWDIEKQIIDPDAIRRADYIIHLAGAAVADKRWSEKRKKEILESRTKSSELIVKALHDIPNNIKAVISASAIGWYIPTNPQEKRIEADPSDPGFLGETCRLWEESIDPVTAMGKRLVKLRTGIVLSNEGGAFPEFKKPIKFGFATILGSGKQIISWVHIDDLCRIYLEAISNEKLQGVYNAVAPRPVDNRTFMLGLAKKIKGKFYATLYVPTFLLKIFLGEMSIEVLKSTDVSPDKIKNTGFQFLYPTVEAAFMELIKAK